MASSTSVHRMAPRAELMASRLRAKALVSMAEIAACIACRGDRQWLRSIERLAGRCIGTRAEHTPEIHYAVFLQAVANQAKPDEEYEGPSALLNFDSHNLPQAFLSASRAPMVFCAASGAASGGTMPISTLNCLTNSLARSFSTSSSILIAC